jgi:subtilase family serine protease
MVTSRNHRALAAASLGLGAVLACAPLAPRAYADPDLAQQVRRTISGTLVIPGSSVQRPQDAGRIAHTNVTIFVPNDVPFGAKHPRGRYETPASLACVYGLTASVAGCNPKTLTTVAHGGSRVIAIVDAYDYPTADKDLAVFSLQFGLPAPTKDNFQKIFAGGTRPPQDPTGGWELEEALDIDMAHALAPNAKIVLVEAASDSLTDLLAAEVAANNLVANAGGGEVSNSWGSSEFPGEQRFAGFFGGPNVVTFAAAGDSYGVLFPSVLPNVIGVGGTSISRTASADFRSQLSWEDSGGGPSGYLPTPTFQAGVTSKVGTTRGTPDIGLIADPLTGVWFYDSTPYTLQFSVQKPFWSVVGGTSVASPAAAAIFNSRGAFAYATSMQLTKIYNDLGVPAHFTDIVHGPCANAVSGHASIGYDFCTGVGTPVGKR